MSEKDLTDFSPLTGAVKRKNFLVLDLESKDGDSQRPGFTRPFMCGVYDFSNGVGTFKAFYDLENTEGHPWDERYYRAGGCVDQMMRYICQKKFKNHHIYAHNGGRFDFLFILPWLLDEGAKRGFMFSIVPVASSIQVLDIWRTVKGNNKWQKWRFLDSYKLIPTGLDKAAKTFGLEGKLKCDLSMHESDPTVRR